jgi:hypothetical protein
MMTQPLPLLSRVADSVYWLSRYVERADNIARYIGVNLNLQLDLPLTPAQQWQPLVETTGDVEMFRKKYGEAKQDNVIEFLAYDDENPSSIASCLRAARENARSVRETISPEMWAQIRHMTRFRSPNACSILSARFGWGAIYSKASRTRRCRTTRHGIFCEWAGSWSARIKPRAFWTSNTSCCCLR